MQKVKFIMAYDAMYLLLTQPTLAQAAAWCSIHYVSYEASRALARGIGLVFYYLLDWKPLDPYVIGENYAPGD